MSSAAVLVGRLGLLFATALGVGLGAGCSSAASGGEAPLAVLGQPAAEAAFRPLWRHWVLGSPSERAEIEAALERLEGRFADDPLVRLSRVVRALGQLERGAPRRARALAREAMLGPPGVAHDLASLVVGAADRREGKHRPALARLVPLLHKMIDPFATNLLDEELVLAALGAHRWADAIRYMEVWQREVAAADRDRVRRRVRQMLAALPPRQLMAALRERRRQHQLGTGREMARQLAQQLAVAVVRARDTALARVLLGDYASLLGDHGEPVARLAAESAHGRVLERTVGLLLSLRTATLRERSADAATGVAFGLGLPGSGARLVTRPEGKGDRQLGAALDELAAEGAAVVVGGLDAATAPALARRAAELSLPVLLLTSPGAEELTRSPVLFTLGADSRETTQLLVAALGRRGAARVVGFGLARMQPAPGPPPAGLLSVHRCDPLPEPGELRAADVQGLVVLDGADCRQPLWSLARMLGVPVAVGLGVRGLSPLRAAASVLHAGVFPVDPDHPDERLRQWLKEGRAAPSWWSALGHDAAVLAYGAVSDLASSSDTEQVKARRLQAASALVGVTGRLWTSEQRRLATDQTLHRRIEVVGGL